MFIQQQPTRQAPGIFTYMEVISSKLLAYSMFFIMPIVMGLLSAIFHAVFLNDWEIMNLFFYFLQIYIMLMSISVGGALFTLIFYSSKSPLLGLPPKGWAIQFNAFFSAIIGGSFLIGQILVFVFQQPAFQEVFFMLGTVVAYVLAFTIYFSFTIAGRRGHLFMALSQPVIAIIIYSVWTAQVELANPLASLPFYIRASIFFCTCAFIFTIPYARSLLTVSNIYKRTTGIGGYMFIRAFVLSMLTDGNDGPIEEFFDKVSVESDVRLQYLAIRSKKEKKLKGLFFIPHIHFGPFKTCGSSDLPEHIYKEFVDIPGTTVYHTTNTHAQNLTTQVEVDKVLERIKADVNDISSDKSVKWLGEIRDFTRKISNSAKLMGLVIGDVSLNFLTRHPLPSDDIESDVGEDIRVLARSNGFKESIIIDSHNSIIGDEILINRNTIEAKDLINVSEKFFMNNKPNEVKKVPILYGVARDHLKNFSEKDGIGEGGLVIHMFKNVENEQKTVLIHFDGNNAFVNIRSFILNMLQNKGIEKGEVTTSDSHTVARQFSSRGYSPIGDKITIEVILEKLEELLVQAEKDLEPVEFHYKSSEVKDIRVWGDIKYFDAIMNTLQECIKVSQRLLSLSLIIPTFFSLVLLLFYYNISIFT